jgi:hypothetical protein
MKCTYLRRKPWLPVEVGGFELCMSLVGREMLCQLHGTRAQQNPSISINVWRRESSWAAVSLKYNNPSVRHAM